MDAGRDPRLTRAQAWALNLTAARQYRERQGHLNVPRRHTETVVVIRATEDGADNSTEHLVNLGKFIDNARNNQKLKPERRTELDDLDMCW